MLETGSSNYWALLRSITISNSGWINGTIDRGWSPVDRANWYNCFHIPYPTPLTSSQFFFPSTSIPPLSLSLSFSLSPFSFFLLPLLIFFFHFLFFFFCQPFLCCPNANSPRWSQATLFLLHVEWWRPMAELENGQYFLVNYSVILIL